MAFRPAFISTPEKLYRKSISSLKLRTYGPEHLEFSTTASGQFFQFVSSADPAMAEQLKKTQEKISGTLRFDFFAGDTVRIRYAEGGTVPENKLPIIVRMPDLSTEPVRCTEDKNGCVWENGRLQVSVQYADAGIKISRNGKTLVSIGGAEKNYFYHWDALNTGCCTIRETGEPLAIEKFALSPADAVYGFGETFGSLNKYGQTLDLDITDGIGTTTQRCYKSVPFYYSTQGYGAFFNTSNRMRFEVGTRSRCDIQAVVDDDHLDYFLFFGSLKEVLHSYTELTGRAPMLPAWSFGYWQSKLTYHSAKEILEITENLHKNGFPCDVIHLDTHWFRNDWLCDLEFDPDRFNRASGWRDELRKRGIHLSVWQIPYIPAGSRLFDRLKAAGAFLTDAEGNFFDVKRCFAEAYKGGGIGIVDYTNPAAVQIMDEEFGRLMTEDGVDVIKTDFGEEVPDCIRACNGMTGRELHNLYPVYYNDAVSEITRKYTGSGIVWARSAWAGSQRYPLHWGGDNSANFENMLPQLGGGLSLGLCGFTFWSQDIGGFLGTMGGKLLVRWMQLGCFLSHCRIHGFGDREPYKLPEPVRSLCRDALQLRYTLMPYLLDEAEHAGGLPILRALVLEYQNDPATWNITDEFLWGRDFLVAPILTEQDERNVYFPAGCWVDYFTKEAITGPCWKHLACPQEHTLLFVREGAIIPCTQWALTVEKTMQNPVRYLICRMTTPGSVTRGACSYTFDGTHHTVQISRRPPADDEIRMI